jgi:hypothetical protein
MTSGIYYLLFKNPHSPNIVFVVLVVVVLFAIIEVLFPRVVIIVLGGTPIVVICKTANSV